MANLITYANTLFKPYYKYITSIFLIILFVLVSKFVYDTYFAKLKKNKDYLNVANTKNTKDICAIYFFYVDWCPHCVKAKPEWKSFKDQYDNKVVNGYVLKCYEIDCTKDNGDEVIQFDNSVNNDVNQIPIQPTPIKTSDLIKKYNIESYPTVKLMKGDVVVEFDSKITKDTLTQFVNSV